MLIVGSSVTKNLHPQVLKHVTNCDITFSKAYTVDYEADAYYPEQNFVNVLRFFCFIKLKYEFL